MITLIAHCLSFEYLLNLCTCFFLDNRCLQALAPISMVISMAISHWRPRLLSWEHDHFVWQIIITYTSSSSSYCIVAVMCRWLSEIAPLTCNYVAIEGAKEKRKLFARMLNYIRMCFQMSLVGANKWANIICIAQMIIIQTTTTTTMMMIVVSAQLMNKFTWENGPIKLIWPTLEQIVVYGSYERQFGIITTSAVSFKQQNLLRQFANQDAYRI